jgi:TPR repeat protein
MTNEHHLDQLQAAYDLIGPNPGKAFRAFQRMADDGSIQSLVYLGYMHKIGLGTVKDFRKSEECFSRAHEHGEISGSYHLGRLFFDCGEYRKAEEVFSSAASNEHLPSIYWLARTYKRLAIVDGVDRSKNITALLDRASGKGHLYALNWRIKLVLEQTGILRGLPDLVRLYAKLLCMIPRVLFRRDSDFDERLK